MEPEFNPNTGVADFSREIEDFDDSAKFKGLNGKLAPKHFFYGAMIAPSGGGKTNCLLNMLMNPDPDIHIYADKIWIFAKDTEEGAYKMLRKVLEETETQIRRALKRPPEWKYFVMSNDLKDVPKVADLDSKIVNVMIFDDYARDKDQGIIEQHYKGGRKKSCSYFYLSQSYYDVPQFVRKQLTHIFLWKLRNGTDIRNILKEHNPSYDDKLFKQIYMECVKEPYSFMLIDKKSLDYPIRMGFRNVARLE